jgi:translation initiation factor 2 subunit 1
MNRDIPEVGELVVVTITEVKNFGAKVKLEEYPGIEGYVHVAEVATGWVKHIRDYLREGQRTVCKVINVNESRRNVELSLKRVNEHQKRDKISEWKNSQKAEKLLEIVSSALKIPVDQAWNEFANDLQTKYGTLYAAFEDAAATQDNWLPEVKGKWKTVFQKVAEENVTIPYVKVGGYLEMYSLESDGIERVKKTLTGLDAENVSIHYIGSPRYRISITETDYKSAEDHLKKVIQTITENAKRNSVNVEFTRE